MNQQMKYGIVFLLLGIAALVIFWPDASEDKELQGEKNSVRYSRSHDSPIQRSPDNEPPVKGALPAAQLRKNEEAKSAGKLDQMKKLWGAAYSSPIDFWGKVIDAEGNPVEGASVKIIVSNDASWSFDGGSNSNYTKNTDKNGLFKLLGKKGAALSASAMCEGYVEFIDPKTGRNLSRVKIGYSGKDTNLRNKRPTKLEPTALVIRRKAPVANIAHSSKKRVSISKTGEAQKINLKTPKKTVEIEIRCWSSAPVPFTYDKYDWQAEMQIVGAKLQEITEFEPVTAPVEGYEKIFKIEVSKDEEETWKASNIRQRDFWVQFDEGTYAKARIEVKTGRKHEVDAEVWYNLDGTSNFEQ